mgnify:CR=1 FL=1
MVPFFSVIITTYNKESYIEQTVQSVLKQTFGEFEVWIIDDASTDNTWTVVERMAGLDARIRVSRNPENKGANYSRNLGMSWSRGAYLIFLDADDLLGERCLEDRKALLLQRPEQDLLVTALSVFVKNPGDDDRKWLPECKDPLKKFLCHDLPWQTMQASWKASFIKSLGGFNEQFSRLQDVELHTRALLVPGIKYTLTNSPVDTYFRVDEARKNFNAFVFMDKWIQSASLYCDTFETIIPENYHHYLNGTIYQTYYQLIFQFKAGQLNKEEFGTLKNKLFSCAYCRRDGKGKQWLYDVVFFYHYYIPRIPGINRVLKSLIIAAW